MKVNEHWTQAVNQTMSQRTCNYSEAVRITAGARPDLTTLTSAFGRPRATVDLFNKRQAAKSRPEKALAKKQFFEFVNEREKSGQPYSMAYNGVARDHPELVAVMYGGAGAQFINAKDGNPPAATSQLKKLLWLPEHATQQQFEAGFKGNGSTLSPLNPAKIFSGLVELAQSGSSLDYDQAIAHTKAAFPQLWEAVELLSKEPV